MLGPRKELSREMATGPIACCTGSGNVGIGTTNPAARLDVTGDINFTGNITKADLHLQSTD
jgi:hypothetical protein